MCRKVYSICSFSGQAFVQLTFLFRLTETASEICSKLFIYTKITFKVSIWYCSCNDHTNSYAIYIISFLTYTLCGQTQRQLLCYPPVSLMSFNKSKPTIARIIWHALYFHSWQTYIQYILSPSKLVAWYRFNRIQFLKQPHFCKFTNFMMASIS